MDFHRGWTLGKSFDGFKLLEVVIIPSPLIFLYINSGFESRTFLSFSIQLVL